MQFDIHSAKLAIRIENCKRNKDFCQIHVDFCSHVQWGASDRRKGCFQWAEGMFPKSGSGASDGWKQGRNCGCLILVWLTGAITRLQDYTLFFVPWISGIAYLYCIYLYVFI